MGARRAASYYYHQCNQRQRRARRGSDEAQRGHALQATKDRAVYKFNAGFIHSLKSAWFGDSALEAIISEKAWFQNLLSSGVTCTATRGHRTDAGGEAVDGSQRYSQPVQAGAVQADEYIIVDP